MAVAWARTRLWSASTASDRTFALASLSRRSRRPRHVAVAGGTSDGSITLGFIGADHARSRTQETGYEH